MNAYLVFDIAGKKCLMQKVIVKNKLVEYETNKFHFCLVKKKHKKGEADKWIKIFLNPCNSGWKEWQTQKASKDSKETNCDTVKQKS